MSPLLEVSSDGMSSKSESESLYAVLQALVESAHLASCLWQSLGTEKQEDPWRLLQLAADSSLGRSTERAAGSASF